MAVNIHRLETVYALAIHAVYIQQQCTHNYNIRSEQANKQTSEYTIKFITLANKSHLENQSKWVCRLIPSVFVRLGLDTTRMIAVQKRNRKSMISVSEFSSHLDSSVNYNLCPFFTYKLSDDCPRVNVLCPQWPAQSDNPKSINATLNQYLNNARRKQPSCQLRT